MANINLTALQNPEPLTLDFVNFTNSEQAVDTILNAPNDNDVGNFWFSSSIILLWLILNWYFYRADQNIQLDISRAILTSSGWCFFIAAGFLLSGITTTIFPLFWFSTLILISWLSVRSLQRKGA